MSKIITAINIAKKAHKGQFRDFTNRPYIEHPSRVASRVAVLPEFEDMDPSNLEELVCIAWLHDVIEDCDPKYVSGIKKISPSVYRGVIGLTNIYSKQSHPDSNRKERKRMEFERISRLPYVIRAIKGVDRLDNLSEMDLSSSFAKLYLKESKQLLDALTHLEFPESLKFDLIEKMIVVERAIGLLQ